MRRSASWGAVLGLLAILALAPAVLAEDEIDNDDKPLASDGGSSRQGFGLGILLGEPSGLTAKVFFDRNNAVQLAVAYDFTDEAIDLLLDFVHHIDVFELDTPDMELPLYLGLGLKWGQVLGTRGASAFGLRFVIGMALEFTTMPLEVFLEAVPVLRFTPVTQPDVDVGAGVRYFF